MSETRKYNTDALFIFPLIEDGDADFVTDYTPAAGDAKLWTDTQISANTTSFILGFDSLSEKPNPGNQIDENGAGTAQAVVIATVIVSGTVGGGDAAGFFFVRSVSGQAWSNNDQIDINGGTANIATADSTTYDLAATAGLIGDIGNGLFAVGLTPTEMTCEQGEIHIVDSSTKVIEDQAIQFTTFGNASALLAIDFDDAVRAGLTALPNAAADAGGGLVISDAGGLDIDAKLANTNEVTVARMGALTDWIDGGRLDLLIDAIPTTAMRGTDNAALASVVGALNDAAAAGEVTTADTLMQYLKQLINILIGGPGIGTFPAEAAPGNAVSLAEVIRAIHVDVTGLNGDAMRGTESAALASVVGALNDAAAADDPTTADTAMQYLKQLVNVLVGSTGIGTFPAEQAPANAINLAEVIRAIHVDVTGLNGDAMRGTNSAALASVLGALNDAAAAGEVTTADTLVQYVKQLINILIGGPGVVTFPAEAAPGNGVSLAEIIRAIHVDTNKFVFTVANQVDANAIAISGDSTAADRLEALMDGSLVGQVNDASATTTAFASDGFTEATDDHFNGRLITFVSGALTGQQTDITDYDAAGGAQGSQEFTVTALTEAPADDDFFVVH